MVIIPLPAQHSQPGPDGSPSMFACTCSSKKFLGESGTGLCNRQMAVLTTNLSSKVRQFMTNHGSNFGKAVKYEEVQMAT